MIFSGKALYHADSHMASMRLYWFDESLKTPAIRAMAEYYVKSCYFEARNIQLWAVPGKKLCLDATFDVDEEYLKKDMARFHTHLEKRGIPVHSRYR